jgi:hypothetical protein
MQGSSHDFGATFGQNYPFNTAYAVKPAKQPTSLLNWFGWHLQ